MKYEANIQIDFDNLDDLSNKLATVLTEMNEHREEINPFNSRTLNEYGDTVSGEGWDIQVLETVSN